MDGSSPHAPWALSGEAILAVLWRRRRLIGALGHGLQPVPGPAIVAAQRFEASPVGPFCELLVLEPARTGARVGWSVTLSVVNDSRARSGGHLSWGLPRELGSLVWESGPEVASLTWPERGVAVRGVRHRRALPFLVGLRALQYRSDGPVVAPVRLRGRAHRADVVIEVPVGDPLAVMGGPHAGLTVAGLHLKLRPARHPIGVLHSLAAPLHPPEPGVAGPGIAQSRVA